MTDPKIIERIGKLLRLAAPSSGTTVSERSSAALEAAKLIDEHGVAIQASANGAPSRGRVAHGVWVLTQAVDHCSCGKCHQLISRGDVVWLRVTESLSREYRHNAGHCRPTA